LPQAINHVASITLHQFLVVFRHTVTGAILGRKQCEFGAGWEGVRSELEVCGCGSGERA